jgi:pimeloyl-ACP methyl ester carboxylesterase
MPWGLLILLAVGLLVGWAMLVAFTAYLLSHPPRRGYAYALARNLPGDPSEIVVIRPDGQTQRGLPFEQWTFAARGSALPVWDVAGLDPAGPAIIITHGWGDSRVVMLSRLASLAPLASRIVMWDLPAHGDAPAGRFTLGLREHEDLLALIETLVRRTRAEPDNPARPIVLYGASLGAGASIVAATHAGSLPLPPAAVIAEAPYRVPSVPARNVFRIRAMPYRTNLPPAIALLGLRFGAGVSWAISPTAGGFDRALHAAKLPGRLPLLLLHGSLDPICPIEDGLAIAAAAPNSHTAIIENAGHNNLWTDPCFGPRCAAAVREFLPAIHPPQGAMVDGFASTTPARP